MAGWSNHSKWSSKHLGTGQEEFSTDLRVFQPSKCLIFNQYFKQENWRNFPIRSSHKSAWFSLDQWWICSPLAGTRCIKWLVTLMSHLVLNKLWHNHRYTPEIREPAPSLPWHGAQFRGLWAFFSRNQSNSSLSDAYVIKSTAVWMWRQKRYMACKVCGCIGIEFALHAWKLEDPQTEPHGWQRHYTGRYRKSGISGVYL